MQFFLGCYTDSAHPAGLKAVSLNVETGCMAVTAEYPVSNALYQALSHDGKILYSCTGEGLKSFRIADSGGALEEISSVALGSSVCHVAELPGAGRVVFADYMGGFAGSVAVEGGVFGAIEIHRRTGSGPNLPRQAAAHCHQACPLPDGAGYAVCDLGCDEIVEYPSGRVFKTSPAGAGPRHLLFHPSGRLAFLVSELGNIATSLSWSAAEGFKAIHSISAIASGATHSIAAAIRFTPDGKGIVVSNRGENSLAVFDFDASGRLAFKSRVLLAGDWPRDFVFATPSLALAACERSGELLAMRYDAGAFEQLFSLGGLFRPVAITVCNFQFAVCSLQFAVGNSTHS